MNITEVEDTPENLCSGDYHILTFAETGFAVLSHCAEEFGLDKALVEEFSDQVNESGEAGSLHPKVPISAIPRYLIRENTDSGKLESCLREFLEVNQQHIKAKKLVIDFQGWVGTICDGCLQRCVEQPVCRGMRGNHHSYQCGVRAHLRTMKYISKTSYMAGLDCHRKLWQRLWDPDSKSKRSGIDQLKMDFGVLFGEVAHCLYPNGVLIDIDKRKLKRAQKDTLDAINDGATVILEATFIHEHCVVLSDIVVKQPDGSWHLIEVKSSTEVKDEHIPDLAYQKWVMEQCGYPVSQMQRLSSPTRPVAGRTSRVSFSMRTSPTELILLFSQYLFSWRQCSRSRNHETRCRPSTTVFRRNATNANSRTKSAGRASPSQQSTM